MKTGVSLMKSSNAMSVLPSRCVNLHHTVQWFCALCGIAAKTVPSAAAHPACCGNTVADAGFLEKSQCAFRAARTRCSPPVQAQLRTQCTSPVAHRLCTSILMLLNHYMSATQQILATCVASQGETATAAYLSSYQNSAQCSEHSALSAQALAMSDHLIKIVRCLPLDRPSHCTSIIASESLFSGCRGKAASAHQPGPCLGTVALQALQALSLAALQVPTKGGSSLVWQVQATPAGNVCGACNGSDNRVSGICIGNEPSAAGAAARQ